MLPRFNEEMLVSTIIPVFNGEKYLVEALESALDQSWQSHEIIVVDDGSSDSTADISKQFGHRLIYTYQPNQGTAAARNRGVELSTGDYLAFLDQDDIWMPEKLALQVTAFRTDPGLEIAFGYVQQFLSPDMGSALKDKLYCASEPIRGVLTSTLMVSRDAFQRVGRFDTRWQLGEWSNWYLRALDAGLKMDILPDVLARRRLHERNKGVVQRDRLQEYPKLIKAALDRRRQKPT
jgi:glycosyltransferase involved in cell wall biosynthesis